jgi:hypothetical protein
MMQLDCANGASTRIGTLSGKLIRRPDNPANISLLGTYPYSIEIEMPS